MLHLVYQDFKFVLAQYMYELKLWFGYHLTVTALRGAVVNYTFPLGHTFELENVF